jgi:hypothetical protein
MNMVFGFFDSLWRYQRFCKAFIRVIFADSSKGVFPVICLQYLQI